MNEAQTRFHIIDKILFECLGWERSDIQVEKHEHRKFTDYEIGNPRLAIIEAKREGRVFSLPSTNSPKLLIDIPSLLISSNEAKEAIEQAQQYCSQRGVPVCIVTNGHQYIIFLASRQDGISVLSGNALVFKSLDNLKENFALAWQMLSVAGLKEKNLIRYLSSGESGIPNKLSSKLMYYPKIRYASETQATLKQLSELFIQDVVENKEVERKFFHECYCESGALSSYALLSKNILEARYASLFDDSEPQPNVSSIRDKKNNHILSESITAEALAHRPIVLIGDVGVGKTSFVKNLIYNNAYQEFKTAIYIYIDLGSKAVLNHNLKDFVLNEIERQINEEYNLDVYNFKFLKGVYASEIVRFSSGVWGVKKETDPSLYETKLAEFLDEKTKEKDQHLKRALAFSSRSTKRQVIISIDNSDQRDYEMQQNAFLISQELAKEWNATVFLAVRPQTFFKSKRSGALTAYPHKIFTISPPRIDLVIKKRLEFVLKMAEGSIPVETLHSVTINARSLAQFIKALLSSLNDNPDLLEFLSNITGGNIRAIIEFVTNFIGCPNVDSEKIIDIMDEQGRYRIPLHEFTKSALLGDYSHYNPDTSIAMNVFDVSSADRNEHFLVSFLLAFLNLDGSHKNNDGFCNSINLFEEMQNYGFTSFQIECALRRMTNKKLIEASQRVTFDEDVTGDLIGDMPTSFRVTSIGLYHLRKWIGVFAYLDAMLFDTPIFDSDCRSAMLPNINSLSITHRFERTVLFKDYLLSTWDSIIQKPIYFNFSECVNECTRTFDTVKNVVDRSSTS